jgi:hypothetical protein
MRNHFLFFTAAALISAQGFAGDWNAAYTKAKASLAKLSQSDKLGLVSGVGWGKGLSQVYKRTLLVLTQVQGLVWAILVPQVP